ncbi:srs domain-containing protein [Neospora caninum Liverpool]|uniref:Srs domain-containing protein n=1 Tax=Neospora caninum (strain Liverpool) TaxID=572307 RepID=F0VA35_NEOCL|nr:srs domain-containing protein [Neospora caninum Liverpool]CBZ50524.1 srs domain-containing protein [Neospora caninum Liverpool]CEL65134.1 TPA: SRS domain-containing protein [Neospora caninum Liverpool]|eukprot:XP_003880557.1 srs domain-containing protein [Neospora caninum Liverpool]
MATIGKTLQRRRGSNPVDRTWMAACMSGILLFCSGELVAAELSEGLQHRLLATGFTTVAPTFQDAVSTCDLTTEGEVGAAGAAAASLTLSQSSLTATLVCKAETITMIPATLLNICDPKQNADPGKCVFDSSNSAGKEVKLKDLLGTDREVKWKQIQDQARGDPQTQTWTLQLEDPDLPLSDKSFLVGCQDSTSFLKTKGTKVCKVPVNVEARASSVGDRNVVTCAYGKNSNPVPLKVEMTTENNTLTLQCGSEGILHPTTYATHYCDPEAANFQECNEKDYTGILPSFVESWWTNVNDGKTSATLTIPETEFPESDQQFRLGCVPNTTNSAASAPAGKSRSDGSQTVVARSHCNVIVTVRSGSSASSTGQMVATVSGTAALIGLLAGSL